MPFSYSICIFLHKAAVCKRYLQMLPTQNSINIQGKGCSEIVVWDALLAQSGLQSGHIAFEIIIGVDWKRFRVFHFGASEGGSHNTKVKLLVQG